MASRHKANSGPRTVPLLLAFAAGALLGTLATWAALHSAESKPAGYPDLRQLLALTDEELAHLDPLVMNLVVAKTIPGLENLDIDRYVRIVDGWAAQLSAKLKYDERIGFQKTPWKWNHDIHFFRMGQLASFVNTELGVRYIEEQKHATSVAYADPSDLFMNGVIDRRKGTCANMPLLHVVLARRLGWPASLACVNSHFVCRFDNGETVFNIEATHAADNMFSAGTDEEFRQRLGVPDKAIESGSDLRSLTATQLLATFIGAKGRHLRDLGREELLPPAYSAFVLAHYLFPRSRQILPGAAEALVYHGDQIFNSDEHGHPLSLAHWITNAFGETP